MRLDLCLNELELDVALFFLFLVDVIEQQRDVGIELVVGFVQQLDLRACIRNGEGMHVIREHIAVDGFDHVIDGL